MIVKYWEETSRNLFLSKFSEILDNGESFYGVTNSDGDSKFTFTGSKIFKLTRNYKWTCKPIKSIYEDSFLKLSNYGNTGESHERLLRGSQHR